MQRKQRLSLRHFVAGHLRSGMVEPASNVEPMLIEDEMSKKPRHTNFRVERRRIKPMRQHREAAIRANEIAVATVNMNMSNPKPEKGEYSNYVTSDRYGNISIRPVMDSTARLQRASATIETGGHGATIRKRKVQSKPKPNQNEIWVRVGSTKERKLLIEDKETGERKMIKLTSKPIYRPIGEHEFHPKDGGL